MTDAIAEVDEQVDAPGTSLELQNKFVKLNEYLETRLIERRDVISTSILALISGLHHFQLGPPGVAKSLSIHTLIEPIEGLQKHGQDYFEVLMTRFTAPEEVFGPYDLNALEDSRFARNTAMMAPNAKFWFIDEIFKANPSILNAFLWALNERLFRNDGKVETLPLWSMFCASNELPEGEELNALYDRVHFRHYVPPIREAANFIQMLKLDMAGEAEKVMAWEDVEEASRQAKLVTIPMDVLEALQQVRADLRSDGIEPTDRRFHQSQKVIRAAAWLDGRDSADIEHLRPLAHMFWSTLDEQPRVETLLLQLANPLDKEAMALLETVDQLATELDKILADKDMDPTMKNKKGVELHNRVDRATSDLKKLVSAVESSGRKSAKVEEVKQRLLSVTRTLLDKVFGIQLDANGNMPS